MTPTQGHPAETLPVRFQAMREKLNPFRTFTGKSRPESGLDCLMCAIFARQRSTPPQAPERRTPKRDCQESERPTLGKNRVTLHVPEGPSRFAPPMTPTQGHSAETLPNKFAFVGSSNNPQDLNCCRANMQHVRQSRPGHGLAFQVKVIATFKVVPSLLEKSQFKNNDLSEM